MAWPSGILTREVRFGPAFDLATGTPLGMVVTFTPSRSMVWNSSGAPAIAQKATSTANEGAEGSIFLPRTDQVGWDDGNGTLIQPDGDNQVFYYTVQMSYTLNGANVVPNGGNPAAKKIAVIDGSGPIDLDELIPVTTATGLMISIPDSWSAQVAAAQQAATAAAASAAQAASTSSSGGTPTDGSVTNAKVANNAAVSLDKTADSTSRLAMTAAERTKLSGVATAATANAADTALRDRTTHTGTQSSDTIVDGSTSKAFTNAKDTKLTGIATGATANSSDTSLRDRSTHTGTQSADSIIDGAANKVYTSAEKTKLGAITGTNTGDQTSVTGNAGTATKLATARTINGVSFDGTANITAPDSTKVPTTTTVNGRPLSANITLTASDVGAAPLVSATALRFRGSGAATDRDALTGVVAGDVFFVLG